MEKSPVTRNQTILSNEIPIRFYYVYVPYLKRLEIRLCQVVAYKEAKNNENYNAVTSKSCRGRLSEVVVYKRFQYGFDWEKFGVLDCMVVAYRRWSHMEVRLYYFMSDCIPLLSPLPVTLNGPSQTSASWSNRRTFS